MNSAPGHPDNTGQDLGMSLRRSEVLETLGSSVRMEKYRSSCAGLTGQAKRKINHTGNEHPSVQDNPSSPYSRPSNPTPKSFLQIQSQVVQYPAVAYWVQCKRAIIIEKAQNRKVSSCKWANVSEDNTVGRRGKAGTWGLRSD